MRSPTRSALPQIDLPLTPAKLRALPLRSPRGAMKPAPFRLYARRDTRRSARRACREGGDDARIIAGGQTLVPLLSMRMARPNVLVDIMHRERAWRRSWSKDNAIRVGAARAAGGAAGLAGTGRSASRCSPHALPWVGHAQTRARGTVCGSVALADPSAEIPLALLALGGERRTVVAERERRRVRGG